jgi:Flp pilus assembly protein CpaB
MRLRSSYRILAAAVCAAVATYLTVSAFSQRTPPPAPLVAVPDVAPVVPRSDTKTVIVAAVPLHFNTPLTADVLAEVQWPAVSVPPGAFSSREALLGAGGRSVLQAIAKNEPILASRITGPGQRGSLSAVIEDGMKAVTIRVDDVLGVAGFVQPGDRVDVILVRNDRASASGRPGAASTFSDVLLQGVRVLAIDQVAERAGQPKPAKAVTIEVDADGVAKVALGQEIGRLSLALLRAGSPSAPDYRRIRVEDLGKEKPEMRRTPVESADPPEGTVVTVTRGTERSYYEMTDTGRREVKVSSKTPPQPGQ